MIRRKCCFLAIGVLVLGGAVAFAATFFRTQFRLEAQATLEGHVEGVCSLAFSPDGKTIASGGRQDGTIKLWDVAGGERVLTLDGCNGKINSVQFSPDGQSIASCDAGSIRLWDRRTGKQKATCDGRFMAFSPDGSSIAVATMAAPITLYDISLNERIAVLDGDGRAVPPICFSPDGALLAAGGREQSILLWEVSSGKLRATLDNRQYVYGGVIQSLAFSPDSERLASGCMYGHQRLWDVATGKMRTEFEPEPSWDGGASVAFSPDGGTLAVGCEGGMQLWGVRWGWKRAALEFDHGWVWCVAFRPDGKAVATADYKGSIKVWNLLAAR